MALDEIKLSRPPVDLVEQELLNHCICHKTSFLCAAQLEEEYQLKVHSSGAGWYLGVVDERRGPVSRDSEYFPSAEDAQKALDNRSWEQRLDPF